MRIGELAKQVGVSVETIRYYEQQGLLEKAVRSEANYRNYGSETAKRLEFIRQCRGLGMSLVEVHTLLQLANAPNADCVQVDALLDEHIKRVREQRSDLAKLEKQLKLLRVDCDPSKQVRGCGILRRVALVSEKDVDA